MTIDNDGLEKLLSAKLEISENLFNPPADQSRQALMANIRHTLFYCIQNQDEPASQKVLFHRQAESFIPQAIKDNLPYFLGIINENSLVLESERSQPKREATIPRRSIEEVQALEGNGLHRATELLAEAKEVGLLPSEVQVNMSDYNRVRNTLQSAGGQTISVINTSGMDRISMLQSQLEKYQQEIDNLSIDIRNTGGVFRASKGIWNGSKSPKEPSGIHWVV